MTDIPDWVLFEAAKRGEWCYRADVDDKGLAELKGEYAGAHPIFRALCDAIAKHEKQPPDRKLLIAKMGWTGDFAQGGNAKGDGYLFVNVKGA